MDPNLEIKTPKKSLSFEERINKEKELRASILSKRQNGTDLTTEELAFVNKERDEDKEDNNIYKKR